MTEKQAIIIDWIVRNVNSSVVPGDEHNCEGLIYNLVHLALGDGKVYNYEDEQDAEVGDLVERHKAFWGEK